jgi:hypothetical protein
MANKKKPILESLFKMLSPDAQKKLLETHYVATAEEYDALLKEDEVQKKEMDAAKKIAAKTPAPKKPKNKTDILRDKKEQEAAEAAESGIDTRTGEAAPSATSGTDKNERKKETIRDIINQFLDL